MHGSTFSRTTHISKMSGCGSLLLGLLFLQCALPAELRHVQQRTLNGILEGVISADGKVRMFKRIPYSVPARRAIALESALRGRKTTFRSL